VADPHDLTSLLSGLLAAEHPPRAWQRDGHQFPWQEADFSKRMLSVHLDPDTHMASRGPEVIARHCAWVAEQLDPGPRRILDVACGPGLYCHEWARSGHQTVGFDFAPAPLAWAVKTARGADLDCKFFAADLTALPPDLTTRTGPVDAITFWFGDVHSFPTDTVRRFLPQLAACLKPGGMLVLEHQPWDGFVQENATSWSMESASPLCGRPHLWLQEYAWDEAVDTEVHAHWILETESGTLQRYVQCHQAWRPDELSALLDEAGLDEPEIHEPIAGIAAEYEFPVLIARRKD